MNRVMRPFGAVVLAAAFVACDQAEPANDVGEPRQEPRQEPPGGSGESSFPETWVPSPHEDRGAAALDPAEVPGDGKLARRLSVDQLRRSIPRLFDGITWTMTVRGAQVPGFDALSRTLGEADYIQATFDNLEPSSLFHKFMDDMAGDVCTKVVARDAGLAPAERLLVVAPEDVPSTLRFMRLKLHGLYVPEGSTEGLGELIALHAGIVGGGGTASNAWYGVCVAMLTAPEFMAY